MRIAVCIKQVPAVTESATDMERGFVIRSGRKRMNPYDPPAVEAALRLRELCGGRVEVFSMGPANAREVLAEALAMGADQGWLLTDPAFAGADSLATARALRAGFHRAGGYDLYVCGQKTTDGDTGQVGAALAALMGLPYIGRVIGFEGASDAELFLGQEHDGQLQRLKLILPAVISVRREAFGARLPSLKLKMQKRPIHELGLADLAERATHHYGSHGSPTRIRRVYYPARPSSGEPRCLDGETAAGELLQVIREYIG